jgi:hypothetical protein
MRTGAGLFSGNKPAGPGQLQPYFFLASPFLDESFDEPSDDFFAISDLLELSDLEESSDFDLLSFLEEESPLEELDEEEDGADDFLA